MTITEAPPSPAPDNDVAARRRNPWRRHPGVRSGDRLTSGERAADLVRNGMGSWPFVFAFLGFMAIWAGFNGNHGFDPYPFILLNLFLSMVAGLQGAILLISAKRADSISSEVALHTLGNTARLQELIEANTALTEVVSQLATQIHAQICKPENAPPTPA
jgi:uncharacterized membrane protein